MKTIPVSDGRFAAIIDDADYDCISQYRWHTCSGYARCIHPKDGSLVYMHRMILNPLCKDDIDHVNGDRMDNRRCNLRLTNAVMNGRGFRTKGNRCTSVFRGVCLKSGGRWEACYQIIENGTRKTKYVGRFSNEIDAALAYNREARAVGFLEEAMNPVRGRIWLINKRGAVIGWAPLTNMQTISIDLKKNPEIADLVADLEPGDNIALYGSIKSSDDQTLVVTISEAEEDTHSEAEDEDLPEGGNEGSAGAPVTPGSLSALSGEDAMD